MSTPFTEFTETTPSSIQFSECNVNSHRNHERKDATTNMLVTSQLRRVEQLTKMHKKTKQKNLKTKMITEQKSDKMETLQSNNN